MACIGYSREVSPTAQLASVLNWLGVPTAWLTAVADWIAQRQEVMAIVATLVCSSRFCSPRPMMRVAARARRRFWCAHYSFRSSLAGFFLTRRLGFAEPDWPKRAWEPVGRVVLTVVLACVYVLSPLGWLISQEPYNVRGTRLNPLFIKQIPKTGPSGATIR